MIAWMCFPVVASSITAAELEAVAAAQAFVSAYLDEPNGWQVFFEQYAPWSYSVSLNA